MKLKFYHTSGTKFKVGDQFGGPGKTVFLTNTAVPHYTIWSAVMNGYGSWQEYDKARDKQSEELRAKMALLDEKERIELYRTYKEDLAKPKPGKVYVYEIEVHGKMNFGSCNDEWITQNCFVEVIRVVGNARGILRNYHKQFSESNIHGAKAIKKKK